MANALNKVNSAGIEDGSIVNADIKSDAAIAKSKLAALNIGSSDIADNAVGLAQMASGTDGQIITYDASGDPIAVGPGTDGQVLTSTGAGSPPAFETLPTSGAALTGSTNNQITTVTGANAIQGEANLVFDGTNLGVDIASPTVGYGGDTGIHIHSAATSGTRGSSIHLTSGTSGTTSSDGSRINTSDNDLVIQNMENGRLDLGTNGAHRLTIKGDGKIGIGEDDPTNKLVVYESATDGSCYITVQNNRSRNAGVQFTTTQGSWYVGQGIGADVDRFMVYDSAEKFSIDASGHAKIHDGDLVIGTSGHGIDFAATAGPSNSASGTSELFADYEEGTWTINPHDGSCDTDYAKYRKIGNQVTVWARARNFSDTSTNDAVRIKGLPYSPSGSWANCGGAAMISNVSEDSDWISYVNTGDQILFYGSGTGAFPQLRHNELNSGHEIYFFATYPTG